MSSKKEPQLIGEKSITDEKNTAEIKGYELPDDENKTALLKQKLQKYHSKQSMDEKGKNCLFKSETKQQKVDDDGEFEQSVYNKISTELKSEHVDAQLDKEYLNKIGDATLRDLLQFSVNKKREQQKQDSKTQEKLLQIPGKNSSQIKKQDQFKNQQIQATLVKNQAQIEQQKVQKTQLGQNANNSEEYDPQTYQYQHDPLHIEKNQKGKKKNGNLNPKNKISKPKTQQQKKQDNTIGKNQNKKNGNNPNPKKEIIPKVKLSKKQDNTIGKNQNKKNGNNQNPQKEILPKVQLSQKLNIQDIFKMIKDYQNLPDQIKEKNLKQILEKYFQGYQAYFYHHQKLHIVTIQPSLYIQKVYLPKFKKAAENGFCDTQYGTNGIKTLNKQDAQLKINSGPRLVGQFSNQSKYGLFFFNSICNHQQIKRKF